MLKINPDLLYATNVALIQRRGSVPCESHIGRNSCSNSNKNRNRKKILRRRSSGGADILSPILNESEASGNGGAANTSWYRFKRDITRNRSDLDSLLSKRRGSLPVEVFAVGHSGNIIFEYHFCYIIYSDSKVNNSNLYLTKCCQT